MTNLELDQAATADICHIRQELKLTAHEVAVAIAKRAGRLDILAAVADDLMTEAGVLRAMARGKTTPQR